MYFKTHTWLNQQGSNRLARTKNSLYLRPHDSVEHSIKFIRCERVRLKVVKEVLDAKKTQSPQVLQRADTARLQLRTRAHTHSTEPNLHFHCINRSKHNFHTLTYMRENKIQQDTFLFFLLTWRKKCTVSEHEFLITYYEPQKCFHVLSILFHVHVPHPCFRYKDFTCCFVF